MAWYRKLHWQIILGLLLGTLYGVAAANWGRGGFTANWIAPFGKIFINLLKLIAVPLVLTSLVCGDVYIWQIISRALKVSIDLSTINY